MDQLGIRDGNRHVAGGDECHGGGQARRIACLEVTQEGRGHRPLLCMRRKRYVWLGDALIRMVEGHPLNQLDELLPREWALNHPAAA